MFRVSSASGDTQTQGVVDGGSPWIVLDDVLDVQDTIAWQSIQALQDSPVILSLVCLDILGKYCGTLCNFGCP